MTECMMSESMFDDICKCFEILFEDRVAANIQSARRICHARILQRTCPRDGVTFGGTCLFM